MEQIEIHINLKGIDPIIGQILPWWLETIGFEGFVETPSGLLAYIPSNGFDPDSLAGFFKNHQFPDIPYTVKVLPDKNWNEEWEKNFEPVTIHKLCRIRAPFHKTDPSYPIEIIIEPKMSFGTGHHATTSLMAEEILKMDLTAMSVLDAGCGTGILSIIAEKKGAAKIVAIDIDEWSYRNSQENITLNNCSNIEVMLGDVHALSGSRFDLIIANINLNILKMNLHSFYHMLNSEGILLMSGILESDIQHLHHETTSLSLITFEVHRTLNNWSLVRYKKTNP
jgi:ribosomal protein L11 methyltransferase